jgi:predicted unusual protein kinase regulating ubiquinone biosynthesis (AarF/ABC1/UbiB family)
LLWWCYFSGNILQLKKKKKLFGRGGPSLGLIDYGQTKTITNKERYGIAKVILALENDEEEGVDVDKSNSQVEKIATAMRQLGFITKNNDSLILSKYARLFFDSDEERMIYDNCPTPQSYFKLLTELDPLIVVPDVAVFVARCGFILRGMGTLLGKQIKTSKRWSVYAKQAIQEEEATNNNDYD